MMLTLDMTASNQHTDETISNDVSAQPEEKKSAAMWRSRISWRIATAVFLTIMTVQASVLALTVKPYQQEKLLELRQLAKSALLPIIDPETDFLKAPYTNHEAKRVLENTIIDGMSVYSRDYDLLDLKGEPTITLISGVEDLTKTYLSADGNSYETVLRPGDLSAPYSIVVRIDSSETVRNVSDYVNQSILVMLLLSAFVTTVLMIALGKWLLEPILFLRGNLEAASASPEAPNIIRSPFDPRDEIGGAISIAQELIRQNAKNMRAIKNAAQSQIHKLAYYDTLTGLPNRILFVQKLNEYVKINTDEAGNEKSKRVAVITLDLDHFKDVNDSMGHNVGDTILRAVGKRLNTVLGDTAVVARTGEDEFSLMYPLTEESVSQREFGEKVQSVIRSEPFKVFNESFQIRSSIGVSIYPDDATDPDQVLKNADIALNRAKEDGRDCIREYLEDFDKAVQARFLMLRDLRDALEKQQLSLHYQPQLDLRSGQVIGAEALIRWWKPDDSKNGGRFISPVEFIPVAEQSGLIVPIGEWVLRKACQTAKKWQDEGKNVRIAVNVSGVQFQQSDLVGLTKSVLAETGLNPHFLELEVTESAFMNDIQHTIQTLKDLHALGVELAIDDFGTGYSSLSYLRQFPIDRLKIDQSFIRNALTDSDDMAIARTIIGLGRSLGLKVIAEGVETREHEAFLQSEGCDEVQGYRYSKPVPEEKFAEFVTSYTGALPYFDKPA